MRWGPTVAVVSLALVTGAAGGWTAEGWHRDHSTGTFAQKQHCSTLAEGYRRQQIQNFPPSDYSVSLLHVAYSGIRNTCIAQVETVHNPPDSQQFEIVDLLSKQTLSHGSCHTPGTACVATDVAIKSDKAFEIALKQSGELPIGLQEMDVSWEK